MCVYDSIIELPHHMSAKRQHMSRHDRAAQFAPFAALTGHDAAIRETARLTDCQIELDESKKDSLNHILQHLLAHIHQQPEVTITYFIPDEKKDGGSYAVVSGRVQKIDVYLHTLHLTDGCVISVESILDLQQASDSFFVSQIP